MKGRLRIWIGMLSTLAFVFIGAVLYSEENTWIGSLLLALGAVRLYFLVRDVRTTLNP